MDKSINSYGHKLIELCIESEQSRESFTDFLCDIVDTNLDLNDVVERFYDFVEETLKDNFRKCGRNTTSSFPRNAWFDNECKELKRVLRHAEKQGKNVRGSRQIRRMYKGLIQKKKRRYMKHIAHEVDEMFSNHQSDYWKFWKRHRKKSKPNNNIDIQTFNKHYIENSEPPRNEIFDYEFMEKISKYIKNCSAENSFCQNNLIEDIMNAPIVTNELTLALRQAKSGKAGGIDGISVEFFKHGSETMRKAILALFNFVFHQGRYPDIWSQGIINPIYKSGMMSQPENYRKITLISALGKLFDSILNNRLRYCKDAFKLDNPWQNGFKQGSRTTDNLFIYNAVIDKYQAKKRPLYVCYVDFKSAFDHINRHALLFKLMSHGFTGKIFTILRDLFSKTKSIVKWNSKLGEYFDSIYGVLQGGVISPTLFNSFIDDIQTMLRDEQGVNIGHMNINHLLQADDLILMSETSSGLQRLLNRLQTYSHRWHLILNTNKTRVTIFNKKYRVCQNIEKFTFDGNVIDECDNYKYLGVIFSNQPGRFKEHIRYVADKSLRAIITSDIYVRSAVGNELPMRLYFKIFDQQIRPILEYASEIWCQQDPIEELERVQLKFLKRTLGVSPSSPNAAIYGETGKFPLHLRQQDQVLKLWLRIQNMPSNSAIHRIYRELLDLHQQGHKNWASQVNYMFSKFRIPTADLEKMSREELKSFEPQFREKRYSYYMHDWHHALNDSITTRKLCTYRMIKTDYRLEPYLLYIPNKRHQRAMARLRVSSHKLEIELGRHSRPYIPRDERLCTFCKQKEIGDEVHFLMTCDFLALERDHLFREIFPLLNISDHVDINHNFKLIMSSRNPDVLTPLGKYIHVGFQKLENTKSDTTLWYHVSRIDNTTLTTECRELSIQWLCCCWWHCWLF